MTRLFCILSADTKKPNMLYQAGLGKELGAVLFTNSISLLFLFTNSPIGKAITVKLENFHYNCET